MADIRASLTSSDRPAALDEIDALWQRGDWFAAIDTLQPEIIKVGRGSAMTVAGWILNLRAPVRGVRLRLGDAVHKVRIINQRRRDAERRYGVAECGFWATIPIPAVDQPVGRILRLEALAASGERFEQDVVHVTFLPDQPRPDPATADRGLVAICMATYEPPAEQFARQIASLRAQTYQDWVCIINDDCSRPETFEMIEREIADDARFRLRRNDERLGLYWNFERALERVPSDACLVALADQDDRWYPDKLSTLKSAIRPGVTLAYSDQRIVDADGRILSETYWRERHNYSRLRLLMVGNTVTGAASMFARRLLDVALPFPPNVSNPLYDHWLAIVAAATGRIAYVDRPLYDYVQHDTQLIGHTAARQGGPAARSNGRDYIEHVLAVQQWATVLLERSRDLLAPRDAAMLNRLAEGDSTWRGLLERARRVPFDTRHTTLGHDRRAVRAALWRRFSTSYSAEYMRAVVDYGPGRWR